MVKNVFSKQKMERIESNVDIGDNPCEFISVRWFSNTH